jgi:hypothetical protein
MHTPLPLLTTKSLILFLILFSLVIIEDKVRDIVYEVGGQTVVNFINQTTKDGGTKYVLWHNKSTSTLSN